MYGVTRNSFAISKAYEWPAALGDTLQTLVFPQPGLGDSLHEAWTASNFHLQNQLFWCPKTAATLVPVWSALGVSLVRAAFPVLAPAPLQLGPSLTQPDHGFSCGGATERSRRGEGAAGKSH